MRKLVFLWLDAFSDKYLAPKLCPFLWNLSRTSFFAKIEPLFAYMGIEYCFEYGAPLNELGVWNDRVFAGFNALNNRQNYFFKKVLKFADKVSPSDDWNKIFRYLLFKLAGINYGTPHLIPADYIDVFPILKVSFKRKSLYEILDENGVKFLRKEPKLATFEGFLIRKIPKLLEKYDAIFLKMNSLDRLGHQYGPLSDKVRGHVKYFDRLIGELFPQLGKDTALIVMSDHGMTPVTHYFDLIGFLMRKGYEFGKHYIAFVGATYTSFWFDSEKCKEAIVNELKSLEVGQLLNVKDKTKLGIVEKVKEYGEEIFVAKEYNVFFPEFYHVRKPPKGMHGYSFSKYDMPIFFMHGGGLTSLRKGRIEFVDIMPTILRLLNLPIPKFVERQDLIVA